MIESALVTDRDTFVATYGPLFEHSPWVAEDAYARGPFSDEDEVYAALTAAMYEAPRERQLALIRAHPDLGAKAKMTPDSTREQAGAGLDRLSPDEYDTLIAANTAYQERFGMPFVICVGEHDKRSIIAAAQQRVRNEPDAEVDTALGEVAKIAKLRMERR
jgi:OHCU decarboxylase